MDWKLIKHQWNDFTARMERRLDEAVAYFQQAPMDEDVAWGAVGVGVVFVFLGLIFA